MGGRSQGGARADTPQFADVALSVAVFADGGHSGDRILALYLGINVFLYFVYQQLHLDLCAHRPI